MVDFFLALAGHALVIFQSIEAVLVERETLPDGVRAKHDVVLFAAGEVLHRGAKAFLWKSADIHLNAFEPERDACLIWPLSENLLRFGMSHDAVQSFRRSGS